MQDNAHNPTLALVVPLGKDVLEALCVVDFCGQEERRNKR